MVEVVVIVKGQFVVRSISIVACATIIAGAGEGFVITVKSDTRDEKRSKKPPVP